MDRQDALSISALSERISAALADKLERVYWVIAEIGEFSVNFKGHCYLDLIDKSEQSELVKAKIRATIWAQRFRMIQAYFQTSTGQELTEGIKILVKVRVEYHELYGLSLNILDIDPTYTVGELARQKQLIINQLIEEGIFNINQELPFPEIPQRLAVISSKKAAGYEDFMKQLRNNRYGYKFKITFYQASMQGKATESDIINCLEQIYEYENEFDAVVIIRGGGSQTDLSFFNSYQLAANVAQFPLPVLTGIGHEKDESIVDMVAHTRLKTPTAVAEFIIDICILFEERLNELAYELKQNYQNIASINTRQLVRNANKISRITRELISKNEQELQHAQQHLITHSFNTFNEQYYFLKNVKFKLQQLPARMQVSAHDLDHYKQFLQVAIKHLLKNSERYLEKTNEKIAYLSPENILQRGYSITYQNGRALKSIDEIDKKHEIETKLYKGSLKSKPT